MHSDSSPLFSAPVGLSLFPPLSLPFTFSSVVSSSPLHTPTSSSPDRPPTPRVRKTSSSVLWLSITMTSLLSFPLSPAVSTRSFFFPVPATLSILLHIHISQASIFFSIALVFVHVSHPYRTIGKAIAYYCAVKIVYTTIHRRRRRL